jgi:uncharacterized protein DUF5047
MLAVSDRFLAAIRDTHAVSVVAYLFRASDPATPIQAPVVDGSVAIDRDARVFRQGSLEVGFSLDDQTTQDLVRELPYGGYAVIERGIQYADGATERVQLGRFRVESIVWNELEGSATLTLADRMAQIQDEAFLTPWVPEGMHPSDAIVAAVQQVFGSTIAYHVSTSPSTEPVLSGTVYDQDRAAAISDLASSIAAEALFDNLGDFVLRPRDRPAEVVWSVDAGARGALIAAEETLDRSSVRNGVSVRGQADPEAPPIYGLATNDDPASPTRWGGPFGRVPLIASSTAVATQAQADAAARALLNLRLGLARTLVLGSIPNPALEPDDLIEVVFADGRSEQQTVNRTEIGLGVDGDLALTTTSQYRPDLVASAMLPPLADVGWVAVE